MITAGTGNLLASNVEALVNTVNTVGVMGKGIALQFKRAYPAMFVDYARAAKRGDLTLGTMHVWHTDSLDGPRVIINFPTKGHWRARSRLADIERGLDDLVQVIRRERILSIAVPPLGCGHGGLDWRVVEPLIRSKLSAVPEVEVRLFAPAGTPPAAEMVTAGPTPTMTLMRAIVIVLLARYNERSVDGATPIATQKLVYLLQASGQDVGLAFERHHYGPYADRLRQALRSLEGHYLTGFGDGSAPAQDAAPLAVLPDALPPARALLEKFPESRAHVDRVLDLVDGFESTYSLELLASVHLLIVEDPALTDDPDGIARQLQAWTPRKARLFTHGHVHAAWTALRDAGWLRQLVSS